MNTFSHHTSDLTIRTPLPKHLKLTDFKLIAFDMDSTLINIECIDELAIATNKQKEVMAITQASMRGEIVDFKSSLRQRTAMLKGAHRHYIDHIIQNRLQINPGARELIQACQQAGLKILLVSGGFTAFSDHVKKQLNIDFTRSNILEIVDNQLTGHILPQAWGDICDGAEKKRTLLELASLMGITPSQCIAMGDGANDIPMMQSAGLSVAYCAKPAVQAIADISITQPGLNHLLSVFD